MLRASVIFLLALGLSQAIPPQLRPEAYKVGKVTLIHPDKQKLLDVDRRIIAGSPASQGQFPYQAAVYFTTSGGTYFCGGSLINEEWILTAAHCATGATSFTILLGGVTLSSSEGGRIQTSVQAYVVHQDYDSGSLHNDIALLKLSQPVSYNSNIQPITLPSASENVGGNVALVVSGYGATSDSSGVSNQLNFVNVHSITNDACANVFGNIVAGQICTQGATIESTCGGDSGGPLVRDENGQKIHVGVVSFVAANACAGGYPAGYTRTAYYRDWISQVSGV